jgi:hypothetical protein
VIYFGYSYTHSRLAVEGTAADQLPANYKPPMAALVGMVLVFALTIYQVMASSDGLGLGLHPEAKAADNIALNLAIRLFAWILTGVLVYMLLYGRGSTERKKSTRSIGLAVSVINIVIWIVITFWYFKSIHGK